MLFFRPARKTVRSRMSRKVRKIIGKGATACVVYPSLSCKDKTLTFETTVSKLFLSNDLAIKEKEKHTRIGKVIDPSLSFTLPLVLACQIDASNSDVAETLDACLPSGSSAQIPTELLQIVMPRGGVPLDVACKRDPVAFFKIIERFGPVLEGYIRMHERGIVNIDSKPQNFLFDDKTERINMIDFGLIFDEREIYSIDEHVDVRYESATAYVYFPPEFVVFDARRKERRGEEERGEIDLLADELRKKVETTISKIKIRETIGTLPDGKIKESLQNIERGILSHVHLAETERSLENIKNKIGSYGVGITLLQCFCTTLLTFGTNDSVARFYDRYAERTSDCLEWIGGATLTDPYERCDSRTLRDRYVRLFGKIGKTIERKVSPALSSREDLTASVVFSDSLSHVSALSDYTMFLRDIRRTNKEAHDPKNALAFVDVGGSLTVTDPEDKKRLYDVGMYGTEIHHAVLLVPGAPFEKSGTLTFRQKFMSLEPLFRLVVTMAERGYVHTGLRHHNIYINPKGCAYLATLTGQHKISTLRDGGGPDRKEKSMYRPPEFVDDASYEPPGVYYYTTWLLKTMDRRSSTTRQLYEQAISLLESEDGGITVRHTARQNREEKISVYVFGVALLRTLHLHANEKRKKSSDFRMVVPLVASMLKKSPETRATPSEALNSYLLIKNRMLYDARNKSPHPQNVGDVLPGHIS